MRASFLLGPATAMALLFGLGLHARAQSPDSGAAKATDPLAVGRAALQHQDYVSALEFFRRYTAANPSNTEALFLLGNAHLGLKQFDAAEKTYRDVLGRDAKVWAAHSNLVLLYAQSEQWSKFDAERAVLAAAHQAHAPGLPEHTADVIDLFTLGDTRYTVREFSPPQGNFHVRYSTTWFDKDGAIAGWIACESDDADQSFFAKEHPAEAAAGKRSYSLDGYSPRLPSPNGGFTQTHSTIKFYEDGEPTYEQVRTDVIAALQKKVSPASSSTTHTGKQSTAPSSGATPAQSSSEPK